MGIYLHGAATWLNDAIRHREEVNLLHKSQYLCLYKKYIKKRNEKQSFSMIYLCWEDMMVLRRAGSVDRWVGGHFWLVNIF